MQHEQEFSAMAKDPKCTAIEYQVAWEPLGAVRCCGESGATGRARD